MDRRSRPLGLILTLSIYATACIVLLVKWHNGPPLVAVPQPLVVTLLPLAAPPEPVEEVPPGPRQQENRPSPPATPQPVPPDTIVPSPEPRAAETPRQQQANPDPPAPETTAPKSTPAPSARQASSEGRETWEALLLAHLEKYRRFPAGAKARREQGVAFVTFRMNRAGQVLSSRIARSSGSAALDRGALETLRRAQPLPRIPDDRPAELEMTVQVEFLLR